MADSTKFNTPALTIFEMQVDTSYPGWHKLMTKILTSIKGVSYEINGQTGLTRVSGMVDPKTVMALFAKAGKRAQLLWIRSVSGDNYTVKPAVNNQYKLSGDGSYNSYGSYNGSYGGRADYNPNRTIVTTTTKTCGNGGNYGNDCHANKSLAITTTGNGGNNGGYGRYGTDHGCYHPNGTSSSLALTTTSSKHRHYYPPSAPPAPVDALTITSSTHRDYYPRSAPPAPEDSQCTIM